MDPLTQGLLGAVTAQLGFRQRIGRSASWLAGLTAMSPDLDVFVGPIKQALHLEHTTFDNLAIHRGLSHSLLMVPLIALPIALVWWLVRKRGPAQSRRSFGLLYGCLFVAVLSHPLLDWCTSYGTQLLAPITNRRFTLDAVPIIDLIYTPILILTLLVCFIAYRRKTISITLSQKIAWTGFAISALYLFAGFLLQFKAINHLRTYISTQPQFQLAPDQTIEYRAYPYLGSIFVWRVTRSNHDHWLTAKVNVLYPTNRSPSVCSKASNDENRWTALARQLPQVRTFDWFAGTQTRPDYTFQNGLHIIDFHDMRYGLLPESCESLWFTRVIYDGYDQPVSISRKMNSSRRNLTLREMARKVLEQIRTP